MRRRSIAVCLLLGLVGVAAAIAAPGQAADHLEAPLVKADGRTDINDVYAFQSPTNPANTVLIMTVNPIAGMTSPTTFRPGANYQFAVDTNGNARPDQVYSIRFGEVGDDGEQSLRVRRARGKTVTLGSGRTGDEVSLAGGARVWAGLSDDPFFFDLQAFNDQVKGAGGTRTFCDATPTNFFAGLNVSSIVLEIPSAQLGTNIGVWGNTEVDGQIVDRMGRPAIATALIPDGMEDAFNATLPHRDRAVWSDEVKGALLFLSGLDGSPYSDADAQGITNLLLPDILTLDTTSSAGFLNGRQLQDDVIDAELAVITGGLFGGSPVLTSDCIDSNDVTFPGTFPYVAPPHELAG
jgi:hypothetical protein